jgi:hypothetical protein
MKIDELFHLHVAKSKGNEDYDAGSVPFVTCSTINNGVIQYVEPYSDDKLFEGALICISGLGFATLQLGEFLPKGNGGDSATILEPLNPMTVTELIYYTAIFNLQHNWRFSFGRKANKQRIGKLELAPFSECGEAFTSGLSDLLQIHLDAAIYLRDSAQAYLQTRV